MIEPILVKAISVAILKPAIDLVVAGTKKAGTKGFEKWEQSKYHAKIQKKISSIESLKTFWSADKLVCLTDFYYPSKLVIADKVEQCQLLSELPDGNIIIEGIVGQGKSIYLRHLATSEIRSNQSTKFPIFIELRTLSEKVPLEQAIKNYLEEVNIDGYLDDVFDYVMSSGKFVLLLDAFDEIEDGITKDTYLKISHYVEKFEKLKIIITSRPSAEIQKSTRFQTVKLAPLRETDYSPFLAKLGLPAVFIGELKLSIKNSPSKISQLITTPLMLTLVVRAYQSVKEIPENLPDFFEVLFKCVFSGHDNAKPYIKRAHATDLSEKKLQELFESFCFICLKNKVARSLTTSQFDKHFTTALKLQGNINCEPDNFRSDMHKVACLILPDGFENWVFLHMSVMEYYAASFVRRSTEEFAAKFYKHAISNVTPWMEALTFLQYIDEYRFNKYFLIEEIKIAVTEIDFIENCKNTKEIVNFLDEMNFALSMSLDLTDEAPVTSLSFATEIKRFCTKNIFAPPLFNIVRGIIRDPKAIEDEEFYEFLKNGAPPDGQIILTLSQTLKLYGDGKLIDEFKAIHTNLKRRISTAQENIRINDLRCDFLVE